MKFESFRGKIVDVDWLPVNEGTDRMPAWKVAPADVPDVGYDALRAQWPDDVEMVVVPKSLAEFLQGARPMLVIKHFAMEGARRFEADRTFLLAMPHLQSLFCRLATFHSPVHELPALRLQLTLPMAETLWSAALKLSESALEGCEGQTLTQAFDV